MRSGEAVQPRRVKEGGGARGGPGRPGHSRTETRVLVATAATPQTDATVGRLCEHRGGRRCAQTSLALTSTPRCRPDAAATAAAVDQLQPLPSLPTSCSHRHRHRHDGIAAAAPSSAPSGKAKPNQRRARGGPLDDRTKVLWCARLLSKISTTPRLGTPTYSIAYCSFLNLG